MQCFSDPTGIAGGVELGKLWLGGSSSSGNTPGGQAGLQAAVGYRLKRNSNYRFEATNLTGGSAWCIIDCSWLELEVPE